MLRNCRGQQRQRLLSKFTENDHEKVDRLLELHFKYLDKVEEVDLMIENQRKVCRWIDYINNYILLKYKLFGHLPLFVSIKINNTTFQEYESTIS